jgi:hypothetical protein
MDSRQSIATLSCFLGEAKMIAKRFSLVLPIAAILAAWILPAKAVQIENVYFPNEYVTEGANLKIRGTALLRYMVFVKAYVGGLYLPENVSSEAALQDVPKRLEVSYFQSIRGKDFGPATNKMIRKNVDSETFQRLQPKIEYHNSLYEDVKPGDRYALTYIPGRGTELSLNGKPKGIIEGSEFASALFSIWLGTNPINKTFKMQILGLK